VTLLLIGLLIGLAAGTLSGLVGIGGGVVIVPALVFLGLSQREASGTSLAALVMPVGLLAVISYARRHEVHFPIAAGIAAGIVIGALLGATLAGQLSNTVLQRIFGALLVVLGFRFLLLSR